jgi:hypothetical protein
MKMNAMRLHPVRPDHDPGRRHLHRRETAADDH